MVSEKSTALCMPSLEAYNVIQRKHHTAFMFMDLHKALDTVFHKILIQKLYRCGIHGLAHN